MSRWKTVGRFLDRTLDTFWIILGPPLSIFMGLAAAVALNDGVWWFEDGIWPWWLYAFAAFFYWQWFFIGSLKRRRKRV